MKTWSFILILLFTGFISCTKKGDPLTITSNQANSGPINPFKDHQSSDRVSIMCYNVENLFDTRHDIGKNDFTFLPKELKVFPEHKAHCDSITNKKWKDECTYLDWSDEALDRKMKALAQAILFQNNGKGPDILVLEEVENISVLESFRKNYLSSANYNSPILIESKDVRGIDTAILSRLPLSESPSVHYIPFTQIPEENRKDTRPFLKATFELPNKELLTVFAVHLPAPYHATIYRKESLLYLNQLRHQLPENRYVVAAGDFNITSEERSETKILEQTIKDYWLVMDEMTTLNEQGTYYYQPKKNWSYLDMILVSKNFQSSQSSWKIDINSIKVANDTPEQNQDFKDEDKVFKIPKGNHVETGTGTSDHWPVYLELVQGK